MDDFILFKFRDDLLKKISESDIDSLSKFQKFNLTIKEIALIWMIKNNTDKEEMISEFYNFHGEFPTAKNSYIKYYNGQATDQKRVEAEFKTFVTQTKTRTAYFSDVTPFQRTKTDIVVNFDKIDNLEPTHQIPMLKWTTGDLAIKLVKGYSNLGQLTEFFDANETDCSHIFKMPFVEHGKIFIDVNKIVIGIDPKEEGKIKDGLIKNFKLTGVTSYQEYINGEFTLENSNFDWNLFAMLLVQKDFYGDKCFLAEDGNVLSKKNKFIIKYYKYGVEFSRPVFFSLSNEGNDLVIKISKIPFDSDIPIMIDIILYLLSDYYEEEKSLIALFKKGIPGFKSIAKSKKIVDKQVKTKTRLEPLKRFDPEIFGGDYKTLCQGPLKQPRIPSGDEVKKLKKSAPDEIIEFPFKSGNYYTCEPFDKKGKAKPNKFPGLLKKDDKYMPCCYPVSHVKRPNSVLNKYIELQKGVVVQSEKKISENILGKEKRLPEFRRGLLPDRLEAILKFIGLDPSNYLRYGVQQSTQSIIHAMAAIADYPSWIENPQRQENAVVKRLMSKSSMLNAAAQSYSYDYLTDALKNRMDNIGASEAHPIVEYFFGSTVMVINGHDLSRPNAKFGFIPHLRKRKSLIILYIHPGTDQVEFLGTYDKVFLIKDPTVINKVLDIKRKCYGYFSPTKYTFPSISAIANRASYQYLDNFGKNRGFIVDGQTILLPPSAPISLPVVGDDIYIGETKTIMDEFEIVGKWFSPSTGIIYSDDFAIPTDLKPDLPELPDDYIQPFITSVTTFIKTSLKAEIAAQNKFISPLELDSNEILTIYPGDINKYLDLVKKLPLFKWEKLANLVHTVGKVHWVIAENAFFMVLDVESKDIVDGFGTWSVVLDKKISDKGNFVEYPDGKYGKIQNL